MFPPQSAGQPQPGAPPMGGGLPTTPPSLSPITQPSYKPPKFSLRKPIDTADHNKRLSISRARFTSSLKWMKDNYYESWAEAYENYKCAGNPNLEDDEDSWDWQRGMGNSRQLVDSNGRPIAADSNNKKDNRANISMPDTWSAVRRKVARLTAQIPNLRFNGVDQERAIRVSRALMHQWDAGGTKKNDQLHLLQTAIFGVSVRAWYWRDTRFTRTKKVRPSNASPEDMEAIRSQYGELLMGILQRDMSQGIVYQSPEQAEAATMEKLALEVGGGLYIPVSYTASGYKGPSCDVLFPGDCFFQPGGDNELQKNDWFCVVRSRGIDWLEALGNAAQLSGNTEIPAAIQRLVEKHPNGIPTRPQQGDWANFRTRLGFTYNSTGDEKSATGGTGGTAEVDQDDAKWDICELWYPGPQRRVEYMTADFTHFLGSFDPYNLDDGYIPFTLQRLIDDIETPIGDSNARMLAGLHRLHDRQVNVVHQLAYAVARPLVWTTDANLADNPGKLKRGSGMRIVHLERPGDQVIGIIGEQAAAAHVITGMNSSTEIERQQQKLTGESNLSMAADVDPSQMKTATGARIAAYNTDVLNKADLIGVQQSNRDDAEMMRMLNKSELEDELVFDGERYNRVSLEGLGKPGGQPGGPGGPGQQPGMMPGMMPGIPPGMPGQPPPIPPTFDFKQVTVTPEDFQADNGTIEPEVGSTLADDDDSHVKKANSLAGLASMFGPGLINMERARDVSLIAMGEGKNLAAWRPIPPPPPPPEKQEVKASVSFSFKAEDLPPAVQAGVIHKALGDVGVDKSGSGEGMQEPPDGQQGNQPPGGPGDPMQELEQMMMGGGGDMQAPPDLSMMPPPQDTGLLDGMGMNSFGAGQGDVMPEALQAAMQE